MERMCQCFNDNILSFSLLSFISLFMGSGLVVEGEMVGLLFFVVPIVVCGVALFASHAMACEACEMAREELQKFSKEVEVSQPLFDAPVVDHRGLFGCMECGACVSADRLSDSSCCVCPSCNEQSWIDLTEKRGQHGDKRWGVDP